LDFGSTSSLDHFLMSLPDGVSWCFKKNTIRVSTEIFLCAKCR
jgi:hypothetical protein